MRNDIQFKYRRDSGRSIEAKGTIEIDHAQHREILRDDHQNILGYFYAKDNETKDSKLNSVGVGNLLSGLLLIKAAEAKRKN